MLEASLWSIGRCRHLLQTGLRLYFGADLLPCAELALQTAGTVQIGVARRFFGALRKAVRA